MVSDMFEGNLLGIPPPQPVQVGPEGAKAVSGG